MTGGVIYAWESFMPLTPAIKRGNKRPKKMDVDKKLHNIIDLPYNIYAWDRFPRKGT